ncbi:MAG: HD-GYP domain-containing protein [Eubacteriales bacterium]|nr:HD-GYP domain-containing protein [Eubacteriales bacterium]
MATTSIMLHKLQEGMIIAEDVYHNSQLLVQKDTVVNSDVMDILNNSSVIVISIYEDDGDTPPATDAKAVQLSRTEKLRSSETFQKFESSFQETTQEFSFKLNDIASHTGSIDLDSLFDSANELMSQTTNTYQLMEILSNIRYFDDSTYAHSLNVAMLVNIFGRWLNYNDDDIKLLTVAGMLHDIGKILIPPEIIKKPGRLTKEEFDIIKQHPMKGYQLLNERKVDIRVCQAALMHHEKCDGSGYPLGVKGDKIPEIGKIITIVDIYEALTANRCYREGICPFEVIKMYEDEGYQKYESKFLVPFLRGISDTYLHNTVLLSDGRKGEIIMTNQMNPSRPGVLVDGQYVDLTKAPELTIQAIV